MNFVDDVLAAMNRDGQYHIVNQSSGSEKPFSYKLKDALNDWKSKSPRRAQLAYANSMAMSVVVTKRSRRVEEFLEVQKDIDNSDMHLEVKSSVISFVPPPKSLISTNQIRVLRPLQNLLMMQ